MARSSFVKIIKTSSRVPSHMLENVVEFYMSYYGNHEKYIERESKKYVIYLHARVNKMLIITVFFCLISLIPLLALYSLQFLSI